MVGKTARYYLNAIIDQNDQEMPLPPEIPPRPPEAQSNLSQVAHKDIELATFKTTPSAAPTFGLMKSETEP